MSSTPRAQDRPTAPRPAPLFDGPPPKLLTIGEVTTLFTDRLGIHTSTFYESFRDFIPFVYTRLRPTGGRNPDGTREYVPGSPRLRADVAEALVRIAAAGQWPAYVTGAFKEDRPELYAKPAAAKAAA